MAKRSTLQRSGQAMVYNFLLNETLASQVVDDYVLWVVAPWVTDFPLRLPYFASFSALIESRAEELRLFDVFAQIAANGGQLHILIGGDDAHHSPLEALKAAHARIDVRVLPGLHAKAYVGHYGVLSGSLNLTGSGVHRNAELYDYAHDARSIAELRAVASELFAKGRPL